MDAKTSSVILPTPAPILAPVGMKAGEVYQLTMNVTSPYVAPKDWTVGELKTALAKYDDRLPLPGLKGLVEHTRPHNF